MEKGAERRKSLGDVFPLVQRLMLWFSKGCAGFQPLTDEVIKERWNEASQARTTKYPIQTLRDHTIEDLLHVNNNLRRYSEVFMGPQYFDYLIHLDTDDLVNV